MAQIEILVKKQLLAIQNREVIASGDSNYDTCLFTFDGTWDGFVKTAVFYQDKAKVQYAVLGGDDTCMIPAAAMARAGRMRVGVFGIREAAVRTSTLDYIDIEEGAISGDNVSTEPTDDVFLAIIAQYQRIVSMMAEYEDTAAGFTAAMREQNAILEALDAFDVVEIMGRLDLIEERVVNYTNLAREIMEREVIIRDVPVKFEGRTCRVENELIREDSLCDVYFDEYSYEAASRALILPASHDGYLELNSSVDISDELTASILVRRN